MVEIPEHGGLQAQLKTVAWLPAELSGDLGRIDRIVAVVTRAIAHAHDQASVRGPLGPELIYQGTDRSTTSRLVRSLGLP